MALQRAAAGGKRVWGTCGRNETTEGGAANENGIITAAALSSQLTTASVLQSPGVYLNLRLLRMSKKSVTLRWGGLHFLKYVHKLSRSCLPGSLSSYGLLNRIPGRHDSLRLFPSGAIGEKETAKERTHLLGI